LADRKKKKKKKPCAVEKGVRCGEKALPKRGAQNVVDECDSKG
jgi:hypothetical protein